MPISVRCSKCGHSYQLRDELAGKQAKCRCGETLSIPVATPLTSLLDEEHIGERDDDFPEGMPPGAIPPGQAQRRPGSSPTFGRGIGKKKRRGKDNTTLIIASVAGGVAGLFVLLLIVFLLTSSDDTPQASAPPPPPPTTPGPPPVQSLPGQATPQETFETFKKAWVANDWARVYSLLTPKTQNEMVSVIAMLSATMSPMNPEFATVAKKHGIETVGLGALPAGADPFAEKPPAKPDANNLLSQAMQIGEKIKDKKAFFVEAAPVFLKFIKSPEFAAFSQMGAQAGAPSVSEGFDMLPMFSASSTLSDVRINGTSASAKAKTPPPAAQPGAANTPPGKEKITPLEFQQLSGSWYLGSGLK